MEYFCSNNVEYVSMNIFKHCNLHAMKLWNILPLCFIAGTMSDS